MSFQIQTLQIPVRPVRQVVNRTPREDKYPFRQMGVTENNFFHVPYGTDKDKVTNRVRGAITNFTKKHKEFKFMVRGEVTNPTTQENGVGVWRVEKTTESVADTSTKEENGEN